MNYYRHFGLFYCVEKMANLSITADLTGRKIGTNLCGRYLNTCAKFHCHQSSIGDFGGVYVLALDSLLAISAEAVDSALLYVIWLLLLLLPLPTVLLLCNTSPGGRLLL